MTHISQLTVCELEKRLDGKYNKYPKSCGKKMKAWFANTFEDILFLCLALTTIYYPSIVSVAVFFLVMVVYYLKSLESLNQNARLRYQI